MFRRDGRGLVYGCSSAHWLLFGVLLPPAVFLVDSRTLASQSQFRLIFYHGARTMLLVSLVSSTLRLSVRLEHAAECDDD